MKPVTKYEAEDGKVFDSEFDCVAYEKRSARIAEVVSKLQPIPKNDGCEFTNGGGYVQQLPAVVVSVRVALLKIAQEASTHKWLQESIDDISADPSWAARIISECDSTPLHKAWLRIMCIDKQFREWGQPFYALHPEQADNQSPVFA